MDKFKNMYEAIFSHIEYSNYLEEYGQINTLLSRVNYNLLMSIYCGIYLLTVVDPLIDKKPNGDVKINLDQAFLNELIKRVATDNGSGYTIGELSYKDANTVLFKIRNKLAHGDYVVTNNNIIFEENGKKGIINIDKLSIMIVELDNSIRDYKSKGKRMIINANLYNVKDSKIYGDGSFKKFCKDLLVMIIEDEPLPEYERNMKYNQIINGIIKLLMLLFQTNLLDNDQIKQILKSFEPALNNYGINLTCKVESVYDSEYYIPVKESYNAISEYSEDIYGVHLGRFILNRILKLSKGDFQTFNYSKGIVLNLVIMKFLKDNKNATLDSIVKAFPKISAIMFYDIDNAIIASDLIGFYTFYQYGLEKGLTQKGNYDLAQIVKKESFDFSLLDLSLLDDSNMIIEHEFLNYKSDIDKYKNKIEILKKRVEKCLDSLNKYLEHTEKSKINEDRLKNLKSNLKEAELVYYENLNLIQEMEKFLESFDFEKYVRNINIIEHIRNAIAHGNIEVDEYNYNKRITDRKITIKNIHDGVVSYQKSLTIYEFASLFKMKNLCLLNDFFTTNISDKEIINEDYIKVLKERIKNRNN